MATIWDWLIERQREKQMMQWRRSVDQAETMALRVAKYRHNAGRNMSSQEYLQVLEAIVEMHRREPGREVDLEKAEEAADRVLAELREIS